MRTSLSLARYYFVSSALFFSRRQIVGHNIFLYLSLVSCGFLSQWEFASLSLSRPSFCLDLTRDTRTHGRFCFLFLSRFLSPLTVLPFSAQSSPFSIFFFIASYGIVVCILFLSPDTRLRAHDLSWYTPREIFLTDSNLLHGLEVDRNLSRTLYRYLSWEKWSPVYFCSFVIT